MHAAAQMLLEHALGDTATILSTVSLVSAGCLAGLRRGVFANHPVPAALGTLFELGLK